MKKIGILALILILTTAVFTGCRRPNADPTELPSTEGANLMPTEAPTTVPTTLPMTEPTMDVTMDTSLPTDAADATDGAGIMGENGNTNGKN